MVDVTEISAIVAAVGVLIGVIYYILDMMNQGKARQTDLVMELYSEAGSKELLEAYNNFFFQDLRNIEYLMSKPSIWVSYNMYCMFYERVGILLHRKLIDIELVDDLFSIDIKNVWDKIKPIVEEVRKRGDRWKAYYEWFEYLYNEMKKREQKLQQSKV
jgi:hypothetical protein